MVLAALTWVAVVSLIVFTCWSLPEKVRKVGRWLAVPFWINLIVSTRFMLPVGNLVAACGYAVIILLMFWRLKATNRSLDTLVQPLGLLGGVILGLQVITGIRVCLAPKMNYPTPTPNQAATRSERVVFVVFDELDYQLAFERRPKDVHLKTFDDLAARGKLYKVMRPGPDTRESIPAIVSGESVNTAFAISGSELKLDGKRIWPGNDTFFDSARKAGFHTGIVGTYIRYERFGDRVDRVVSYRNTPDSYLSFVTQQFNELWSKIPQGVFEVNYWRFNTPYTRFLGDHHRKVLENTIRESKAMLADRNLDFVYLHLQLPHGPHLFDTNGKEILDQRPTAYSGSLQKCDSVLKELVDSNRFAGATTWVVTSDHNHRDAILGLPISKYVPLLLFNSSGDKRQLPMIRDPEASSNAHDILEDLIQRISRASRKP